MSVNAERAKQDRGKLCSEICCQAGGLQDCGG